ncbi:MAG: hypothetical protein GF333_04150 [Candidatus Omnitrophica bacterium]|nr:hypothetical protein [Candidatus Omnitrophota bacterium]
MIQADIRFLRDDVFEVKMSPSEVEQYIDKKKEGAAPQGPNPLEMLLASLGGCIGIYAKTYLRRHALAFGELRVRACGELTTESPVRLVNLKIEVRTDAELGPKKNVFMKFLKGCPVHNTVLHTDHIEIVLDT